MAKNVVRTATSYAFFGEQLCQLGIFQILDQILYLIVI